ncbi:hypothetical protein D3C84_1290190 [compost metagenome]
MIVFSADVAFAAIGTSAADKAAGLAASSAFFSASTFVSSGLTVADGFSFGLPAPA